MYDNSDCLASVPHPTDRQMEECGLDDHNRNQSALKMPFEIVAFLSTMVVSLLVLIGSIKLSLVYMKTSRLPLLA
jgi:hypothetical protein